MKWEYLCQRIIHDAPNLEQGLDKLGDDHWELVGTGKIQSAIGANRETLILFFKRPKREVPDPPATSADDIVVTDGPGQQPRLPEIQ